MTDKQLTKEGAVEYLTGKLKARLARIHISMDEPDLPQARIDALARDVAVVNGHIHLLEEIAESLP